MNKKINILLYFLAAILVIGGIVFSATGNFGGKEKQEPNGQPSVAQAASGVIGKKAPDFSLPDINGKMVKLSDLKGKNVVLFFNEGQMCYPACWNQIEALGSDSRFDATNTVSYSIVVDTPSQWQDIENQMPQYKKARILFDTGRSVSSAYGVLSLASSMHPGIYPGHTYFVVDKNGVIRFFLDDPNMAVRNDQLANELIKLQ